jgi:hypothetical protein
MVYEQMLKLNDTQYIAVLDKALVIVTTDENGKPIRWAIFGEDKNDGKV